MIGPMIFLDIDGVLNRHNTHDNGYNGLDVDCVAQMNAILENTGAKIVLVSAWRYFVLRGEMTLAGLQGLLCTHGLKWGSLIDVLGPDNDLHNLDRGQMVLDWFAARYGSHGRHFVCIDDLDLGYTKHGLPFFQTDSKKGIVAFGTNELTRMEEILRRRDIK